MSAQYGPRVLVMSWNATSWRANQLLKLALEEARNDDPDATFTVSFSPKQSGIDYEPMTGAQVDLVLDGLWDGRARAGL